jgi:hypothetical protein
MTVFILCRLFLGGVDVSTTGRCVVFDKSCVQLLFLFLEILLSSFT